MKLRDKIIRYNRMPVLSSFFDAQLDRAIGSAFYQEDVAPMLAHILITRLTEYKTNTGGVAVVGISGGIDSAVTAALFKRAGYRVIGITMPIHQNPEETARGFEACQKLGIEHHNVDLTAEYESLRQSKAISIIDPAVSQETIPEDDIITRKRAGNIRARLRMITLYNMASLHGGLVGSTDNFSELAAGFWTLHGDVGDVAPIQSLNKSYEVPALAEFLGVPQSIIDARPTDGLNVVGTGDEDQLGMSYLEFDLVLAALIAEEELWSDNEHDRRIFDAVKRRIRNTSFKRNNPLNFQHPTDQLRLDALSNLDTRLELIL